MKLNREQRRLAKKNKLDKCPDCGNYKIDAEDNIVLNNKSYCFDCGIKYGEQFIENSDKQLVLMVVINKTKTLIDVNNLEELKEMYKLDSDVVWEINTENNNPVLWAVKGEPKTKDRRVIRVAYVLKGVEHIIEYVKQISIEDLIPFEEENKETENLVLTPMMTISGEFICWRVTLKTTGFVTYMPIDGYNRLNDEHSTKIVGV